MKRYLIVLCILHLMATAVPAWAKAPREIAGYRLGQSLDSCYQRVVAGPVYPVRLRPYLMEVPVVVPQGFHSGYIIYGNCADPGIIARIKVKYANDSRRFFDQLLNRLKQRFGDPDEYKGDAFQAYLAWKWSFEEPDGQRITMILSHYSGDDDEHTQGNALKLTLTTQIAKERRCYEAEEKRKPKPGMRLGRGQGRAGAPQNWDNLLPRP
ncbi:hypothetical protein SAMN02746041_01874 [Desulfacinum hydrothermale DSM 13146]|uniref:Uncharacterized protein n=1 Tax=Desulfacinum hydrothermale DSM 13146 TaxID=1121390 RepID=A0A1W1XIY0_9BACT|nr:hypothetical protein [Desulfacinum hydrothermale]SMC23936.1 hypothetical protein SAMN02746041_01874 [Desulfacinum hydrothermale DSM 13146]